MKYWVIMMPFLKVSGMAIYPFILLNDESSRDNQILINHEKIHLRQQAEMLVIPFYILYLLNYLINLIRYRNHHKAYMNIYFECEAYIYEGDLAYLQERKWYNWVNCL